jgi:hypothetical protein
MTDAQLQEIMYALTLADRPKCRDQWIAKGFQKQRAIGKTTLLDYWKKRLTDDPDAQKLADQVWAKYVEHQSNAQQEEAGGTKPAFPPLRKLLVTYAKEVQRWQKAGRPNRSDAEVERLYAICSSKTDPCVFFVPPTNDEKKGRCSLCGCRVNVSTYGILNKLRMATTSCPDAPPKFTAEVIAPLG